MDIARLEISLRLKYFPEDSKQIKKDVYKMIAGILVLNLFLMSLSYYLEYDYVN